MGRIDIHAHVVPETYRKYSVLHGYQKPDGMPGIPQWSAESHLELMETLNIDKSILSITSPGTHLVPGDNATSRKITREVNEEIASICSRNPSRFGFFASLPLPDVGGSINEIDFALDRLGAHGFALMTNAQGLYLGDSELDAVFAKLNDRKAVVFIHPTTCCNKDPQAAKPLNQYPSPMLEFFFDTTRAVANLLLSGTITKYPDITYIIPHGGSVLPALLERFTSLSQMVRAPHVLTSDEAKELFKTRFYFDLAGFPFPDQIHGLLRITDPSRLVYGSDFPYTPAGMVVKQEKDLNMGLKALVGEEVISQINSGNAMRLLRI